MATRPGGVRAFGFSLVWYQYTETWWRQPLSLAVGNNMLLCKPGAAIAWSRRSCLGKRRVCRARRAHQSMQASNECAAFSCAHGCAGAGKACVPCAQTPFVCTRGCPYPLRTNGARVGQAPRWHVSHTTKRRGKSFASSEQGAVRWGALKAGADGGQQDANITVSMRRRPSVVRVMACLASHHVVGGVVGIWILRAVLFQ